MKLAFYAPVKNEERMIEEFVNYHVKTMRPGDVFVFVDTGSTDSTTEKIKKLQEDGKPVLLFEDYPKDHPLDFAFTVELRWTSTRWSSRRTGGSSWKSCSPMEGRRSSYIRDGRICPRSLEFQASISFIKDLPYIPLPRTSNGSILSMNAWT